MEKENLTELKNKFTQQENLVSNQTQIVASQNVEYENMQQKLPDLRQKESKAASELQKNSINLDNQEKEIERAKNSVEEMQIQIEQIKNDVSREQFLLDDAKENLVKLQEEKSLLEKQQGDLFADETTASRILPDSKRNNNPIIDYLDFDEGYENTLAAVFADELMASMSKEQSSYWKILSNKNYKSEFPDGIVPLSSLIKAPENLKKRLDFIGLVKDKKNIQNLQNNLSDGQILVSELGEIWRWDGFTSKGKQNASTKAVLEQLKNRRLKQLSTEEKSWQEINNTAQKRIEELILRQNTLKEKLIKMQTMPEYISSEKQRLIKLISLNKEEYNNIVSNLQKAEHLANETNKKLKLEEVRLNELREEKIKIEGIIATHNETIKQISEQVKERLHISLEELYELAKIKPDTLLPSAEYLEKKLERLISEQERLGGVNLLAEQEAEELDEKVSKIKKDQSDLLSAAIAKLREAIDKLNTEGRQRLLAAYGVVNENFQKLFIQLFGGGKAYLKFTDESDPLQAGLEVYASPPGKKLQNLTLLSGGEQALTALSLLFAVFLSNPAPICVLDEVDAPLDDTNVDRFCTLVEKISKTSATKFLVITHHRMTMARVNRLFGVTMPEKGISQIVSVDLESAVQLKEDE